MVLKGVFMDFGMIDLAKVVVGVVAVGTVWVVCDRLNIDGDDLVIGLFSLAVVAVGVGAVGFVAWAIGGFVLAKFGVGG
jgi:hypothetical protein